jgi:hypothetical protein
MAKVRNTHDNGRLFGTDGVSIWTEPALELVDRPAPRCTCEVSDTRCAADACEGRRVADRLADGWCMACQATTATNPRGGRHALRCSICWPAQ